MSALRLPLPLLPGDGLRITRWRPDPDLAHVSLAANRRRPLRPGELERRLHELQHHGCRGVVTAALAPTDQQAFLEQGFHVVERLHLLRHHLLALPRRSTTRTRRARRRDHEPALAIDRAAFVPFWQLDETTLTDALAATRSARFRVIDGPDGEVAGYAVCGRSATRGYVQRLAVHPRLQGHGYGTALLLDGLRWLARWHALDALVNTQEGNDRSLRLYLRNGFEIQPGGLAVLRLDFAGPDEPADPRPPARGRLHRGFRRS
jgi:ribosomal protein S18 acetylase RimI-like enzyme